MCSQPSQGPSYQPVWVLKTHLWWPALRFRTRRELVGGVAHDRAILFGRPVAGKDTSCLQWVPWDNGIKLGFGTMCKSLPSLKEAMQQMKLFIMSAKIPGDWPRTYPGLLDRSSPLLASPSIFLPDQVLQQIAKSEGSTDFQKLALWIVNDVNAAVNRVARSSAMNPYPKPSRGMKMPPTALPSARYPKPLPLPLNRISSLEPNLLPSKVNTGKRSFSDIAAQTTDQPSKILKPMDASEAGRFPQGLWMQGVVVGLVEKLTGASYIPTPPSSQESHSPYSLLSQTGSGFSEVKGQQMAPFRTHRTQSETNHNIQLDGMNANSKQTLQSVLSVTYQYLYRSRMMEKQQANADKLAQHTDHQQYPSHGIF